MSRHLISSDSWGRNYHELVREYGPPRGYPSLFLFGRDEFCTSESHGNNELRPLSRRPSVDPPSYATLDRNHAAAGRTIPSGTQCRGVDSNVDGNADFRKWIERYELKLAHRRESTTTIDSCLTNGTSLARHVRRASKTDVEADESKDLVKDHAEESPYSTDTEIVAPQTVEPLPEADKPPTAEARDIFEANDSMLSVLERFIRTHFDSRDRSLSVRSRRTEVPLEYYWDNVYDLNDGKRSATVRIENFLTIKPDALNSRSRSASQHRVPHLRFETKRESTTTENAYGNYLGRPENDVLEMVRQKVQARQPLDWTELFLLKHDHCCRVVPKERCLKRLKLDAPTSHQCRQLENEILHLYATYQQTLDHCKPADNAYTRLAHMIMLAEAHWYAARISSDPILRKHNYEIAARRYEELFAMAQHNLDSGDRSLLTIIEKMTQIMLESSHASHVTFSKCRSAIASAEEAIGRQHDLKRERKLIKIKDNLVHIEANLL